MISYESMEAFWVGGGVRTGVFLFFSPFRKYINIGDGILGSWNLVGGSPRGRTDPPLFFYTTIRISFFYKDLYSKLKDNLFVHLFIYFEPKFQVPPPPPLLFIAFFPDTVL